VKTEDLAPHWQQAPYLQVLADEATAAALKGGSTSSNDKGLGPAGVARSVLEIIVGTDFPSLQFRVARFMNFGQLNKST
jgi:hypothetical protein